MRRSFTLAAAGLAALIAIPMAANAFVLETKGPLAKWRSDMGKSTLKYTVCQLNAWQKCEAAATKLGVGGPGVDCDITEPTGFVDYSGADSVNGPTAMSADLAKINAALVKCDAIVNVPGDPKKGLKKKMPAGYELPDIGCPGDCDSGTSGDQACADVVAYEASQVDPAGNNMNTAYTLGANIGVLFCGAAGDSTGAEMNEMIKRSVKYINSASTCQAKCQDDFKSKAGDGFFDDGTRCLIASSTQTAFTACIAKAEAGAKINDGTLCQIGGTAPFDTQAFLKGKLDVALDSATAGTYDKTDRQSQYLVALGQTSLSDRDGPGVRVSYGATCATCGNGVLEDFEECDGAADDLCPVISGGTTCGTSDNPLTGEAACKCNP